MYIKLDASMRTKVEWKLVEDLFNQRGTLWAGGLAPFGVAAFAYFRTGEAFYIGWAVLTMLLMVLRLAVDVAFSRRSDRFSRLDVWRGRFLIGTWLNGGLAGLAATYTVLDSDLFNQMLVVSQLTSFVMGSAARNSLHPRAAAGSILLAEGPLFVGCLITRDIQYLLFTPLIVLFTIAATSIMKHLYIQTVRSIVINEEKAQLVARFESELAMVKRMESELNYAP